MIKQEGVGIQLRSPDWFGFDRLEGSWFLYVGRLSIGWNCRVVRP